MSESELQRKYERSQRRWGNLKSQIKSEIEVFSGFTGQKGAMYANRIAGPSMGIGLDGEVSRRAERCRAGTSSADGRGRRRQRDVVSTAGARGTRGRE